MSTPKHDPARTRARRDAIVAFVAAYSAEHGRGPTIREVMGAVGITSTSVTRYHLLWLARHGEIDWTPVVNRGALARGAALVMPGTRVAVRTGGGCRVVGAFEAVT